jgi:hypothetical protein
VPSRSETTESAATGIRHLAMGHLLGSSGT